MSTLRTPVGPQPANVYWRRRALVGLGLLAVILIIVLIIVRPGADALAPPPTDAASTGPTDAAAGDPADCASADIEVVAVTDANRYEPGVLPLLSLTIENKGTASCVMAVGTDVQEYRVTSGTDTIWSSKDCQQAPEAATMVIEGESTVSTTPIPWDRTRSSTSTCEDERPAVGADGASYHLTVVVNGVQSKETKQFLLF